MSKSRICGVIVVGFSLPLACYDLSSPGKHDSVSDGTDPTSTNTDYTEHQNMAFIGEAPNDELFTAQATNHNLREGFGITEN